MCHGFWDVVSSHCEKGDKMQNILDLQSKKIRFYTNFLVCVHVLKRTMQQFPKYASFALLEVLKSLSCIKQIDLASHKRLGKREAAGLALSIPIKPCNLLISQSQSADWHHFYFSPVFFLLS